MKQIFSDFEILRLVKEHEAPGVFLKARKPLNWSPIDLSDVALYSMILGRRTKNVPNFKGAPLARRLILRLLSSKARWLLPGILLNLLERGLLRESDLVIKEKLWLLNEDCEF
jgi:hypothetical protein